MENSFLKHSFLWVFAVVIGILLIGPLLGKTGEVAISADERASIERSGIDLTQTDADAVRKFNRYFVDSGAVEVTMAWAAGDRHTKAADVAGKWAYKWVTGLWGMVFRWMWRWEAFVRSLVGFLSCIFVPLFVDGLARRMIKSYEFGYQNPYKYYAAKHAIIIALGLMVCFPLLPVSLSVAFLVSAVCAISAFFWVVTSNFQTG